MISQLACYHCCVLSLLSMPPLDLDFKQGIINCVEPTIQPGSHKEITRVPFTHSQYTA